MTWLNGFTSLHMKSCGQQPVTYGSGHRQVAVRDFSFADFSVAHSIPCSLSVSSRSTPIPGSSSVSSMSTVGSPLESTHQEGPVTLLVNELEFSQAHSSVSTSSNGGRAGPPGANIKTEPPRVRVTA